MAARVALPCYCDLASNTALFEIAVVLASVAVDLGAPLLSSCMPCSQPLLMLEDSRDFLDFHQGHLTGLPKAEKHHGSCVSVHLAELQM